MIDIKFKADEQILEEIKTEFNLLFVQHYPDVLQWNHYELWQKSGKKFTPEDWKRFRLNDKVDEWYNEEIILIAKQKQIKLLSTAGDRTSVADAQALNQVTSFLERNKTEGIDQTVIIYSFVDLNENEKEAANVRVIKNIPVEIEDALISFKGDKQT
jgi:DNA polymerase elongation subunit (family B)